MFLKKQLKNLFFRSRPFGLDISDSSIEMVQLAKRFAKPCLKAWGRIRLENGIVENGKISDPDKFREKVSELIKNAAPNKIKTDEVFLFVPGSKSFTHIFELPANLKGEMLLEAVRDAAFKTIPLDPSATYFDFQIISRTNESQEIFLAAAPKDIIDGYLEAFQDLGLKPLVLDIEAACLARAFRTEASREGGVLIIDLGAKNMIISVVDEIALRLNSIIPIAGDNFTSAISKEMEMPLEKANEIKKIYGLDEKKENGRILFILQNVLKDVVEKIRKVIDFYEMESGKKIEKIILCGGSSLIPKLPSYFALNLGIETELGNPLKGITKPVNKEFFKINNQSVHPILFSNAIGLALRALEKNPEENGINLIPLKGPPKPVFIGKRLNKSRLFSFFVVGLTIAALIFFSWVVFSYILKPVFSKIPPIKPATPPSSQPAVIEEKQNEESALIKNTTTTPEIIREKPMLTINQTETGWLKVRQDAGTNYPEIAKIYPGESYPLLEETENWYKIELKDGKAGWISASYAKKMTE